MENNSNVDVLDFGYPTRDCKQKKIIKVQVSQGATRNAQPAHKT